MKDGRYVYYARDSICSMKDTIYIVEYNALCFHDAICSMKDTIYNSRIIILSALEFHKKGIDFSKCICPSGYKPAASSFT